MDKDVIIIDFYEIFSAKFRILPINRTLATENDRLIVSVLSQQDKEHLRLTATFFNTDGEKSTIINEVYTAEEYADKEEFLNYRFQKKIQK